MCRLCRRGIGRRNRLGGWVSVGLVWGGGRGWKIIVRGKGGTAVGFVLGISCDGSGVWKAGELSEKYLHRYIAFGSMTEQLSGWGL